LYLAFSKYNNTILGNCGLIKSICVFRLNDNEQLIDTGLRLSTEPYRNNLDITITPDGRFCYTSGNDPLGVVYCEILPDGEVIYKGVAITGKYGQKLRTSNNSNFFFLLDEPYGYTDAGIHSYRIEDDGRLTYIDSVLNIDYGECFDITLDDKYIVVNDLISPSQQRLSVIRLYPDGTLEKLDKDVILSGHFSDIRFIPPYVTAVDDIWECYK
jgi:6-phosphogluconolactonase (cycloisomerase 2 family)